MISFSLSRGKLLFFISTDIVKTKNKILFICVLPWHILGTGYQVYLGLAEKQEVARGLKD